MFNLIFNSPDKMLSVDTDNGDIESVSYINTRRVTVLLHHDKWNQFLTSSAPWKTTFVMHS